jgi:hypothetical protein
VTSWARRAAPPGPAHGGNIPRFLSGRPDTLSLENDNSFSHQDNYKVWLIVPNRAQSRPEGEQIPRYFLDEAAIFSHRALWIE